MAPEKSVNGHRFRWQRRRTERIPFLDSNDLLSRINVIGNDVARLAKLQGKLLIADYYAYRRRLKVPMLVLFLAVIVLIGAAPIALLGASLMVAEAFEIRTEVIFLGLGSGCLVLATLLFILAAQQITRAYREFDRTRIELKNNFKWVSEECRRNADVTD